jgi:hypothetical protein
MYELTHIYPHYRACPRRYITDIQLFPDWLWSDCINFDIWIGKRLALQIGINGKSSYRWAAPSGLELVAFKDDKIKILTDTQCSRAKATVSFIAKQESWCTDMGAITEVYEYVEKP